MLLTLKSLNNLSIDVCSVLNPGFWFIYFLSYLMLYKMYSFHSRQNTQIRPDKKYFVFHMGRPWKNCVGRKVCRNTVLVVPWWRSGPSRHNFFCFAIMSTIYFDCIVKMTLALPASLAVPCRVQGLHPDRSVVDVDLVNSFAVWQLPQSIGLQHYGCRVCLEQPDSYPWTHVTCGCLAVSILLGQVWRNVL